MKGPQLIVLVAPFAVAGGLSLAVALKNGDVAAWASVMLCAAACGFILVAVWSYTRFKK